MCIPKHFVHTGSRQNGTFKTRGNMSMRRHIRKYSQKNNFISRLYKQILFILKCLICRYIDRLANIFFYRSMYMSDAACGRVDSVMDSHTTVPGFKTRWVRSLSFERLTDYHHISTIRLSVRWCVWEDFPIGSNTRH